ncbi:hypothetical protein GCM10029976_047380 [Kribbella albertanoniae]|uniref:Uncharacterized protein n=1 Tax=Kribbella albertanoniae TaxID=1266829 RepID=A0A4V2XND2_9ACTN|nr:hypothetical protein [Kribbella albertanoniae]TDC17586.1 hypothetical protein E1261_36870 [Kribbella albertanoniae]
MSFDRPGVDDKHEKVSETEVNQALENGEPTRGGFDFDEVEQAEQQRSSGPQPAEGRRGPKDQDVRVDDDGTAPEPPD